MFEKNTPRNIVALKEVASLHDSLHKTPKYTDRGYQMIRVTDIKKGYVNLEGAKYVDEKTFNEFTKNYAPNIGDTIFTRVGSYGNSCFVNRSLHFCLGQNTVCINPNKEKIDAFYLYCCLNSPQIHNQISSLVGGASQPTISLANIRSLSIPVPSLPTQNKIAAILYAYDDLIENNTLRIKILEEMAQVIYREWFVEFRFPGHEDVEMVEGPDGRIIPEGWEVLKLGDKIELLYGKALKSSKRKNGKIPVYGSSGIVGLHNESLSQGPGIIVGRKGNVGSVYWSDTDFYAIDTVYFVKTDLSLYYIYYNLQSQNFINNDAAVPGLNRNQAYSLPLIIPGSSILTEFERIISDIFTSKKVIEQKTSNLKKTRDLLLPRLIEGEIDVSELDISTLQEMEDSF